jgi:hypothetical protein
VCDPANPNDPNAANCLADCSGYDQPDPAECIATVTNPPANSTVTVGDPIEISCQGNNIDSYTIVVQRDNPAGGWLDVTEFTDVAPGQTVTFTPQDSTEHHFQCIGDPVDVNQEDAYCPIVDVVVDPTPTPDPVCEDISVSPSANIAVGEDYTVTCE